jgi:thiamine biosynthesis lipoprotein
MQIVEEVRDFMKTKIRIKVIKKAEGTIEVQDAIENAFGEFDRIVKNYTRFNENSELSNLNRNSGKWVKISQEFFDLVEFMLQISKDTDGSFDPTVIDFLETYGYDRNYNFSKLENPELDSFVQNLVKKRKSWGEIKLDKESRKIKLAEGQKIDLGAVGKGYAIDCAFEKLEKIGNFLIDAGGDIRAKGKNERNGFWEVGLMDKSGEEEKFIGTISLQDEALASSGSWARKVKQFHHLINPKTGKPENARRTVYVKAKTAMIADAWATAIFVSGSKDLSKQIEKNGLEVLLA